MMKKNISIFEKIQYKLASLDSYSTKPRHNLNSPKTGSSPKSRLITEPAYDDLEEVFSTITSFIDHLNGSKILENYKCLENSESYKNSNPEKYKIIKIINVLEYPE